jgi:hypothetical protein
MKERNTMGEPRRTAPDGQLGDQRLVEAERSWPAWCEQGLGVASLWAIWSSKTDCETTY